MTVVAVSAPPSDFEFKVEDACSSAAADGPKMSVTRRDGQVVAEISTLINCADHIEDPHVEYTGHKVVLSAQVASPADGTVASCFCGQIVTFKLLRPMPKGTQLVFRFTGDKPLVSGVAP